MTQAILALPLAAAGGDPAHQLKHLKAHLAFQNQDQCEEARIGWATIINRHQSREHITRHLHRKINSKVPSFHGPGKLDSEEGQTALETTARYVRGRMLHGGNGFHLIGWNLGFRMFRERSRCRGLAEEAFWEILADEPNSPRLRPKENSFPEHIQYRLALRRMVSELIRAQGANPRHHKNAVLLETHLCPLTGTHLTRADADERGRCPHCTLRLNQFSLTARAFDPAPVPGDPPVLIAPGTWRHQPGRRPRKQRHLLAA